MCGRYASITNPAALAAEFAALDRTGDDWAGERATGEASDTQSANDTVATAQTPTANETAGKRGRRPGENYNVAPTNPVFAVLDRLPADDEQATEDEPERELRVLRWGLIPHWASDARIGAKMINARAETVHTKPAFRSVIRRHRCVLPADGWYEWRTDLDARGKPAKQPYFMTRPDGRSLALAGIWSTWRDPNDGRLVRTAAVLTTAATGQLAEIHERMPLVLDEDLLADWLDPRRDDVTELLADAPRDYADELELRPVSDRVNSVRNNGPELLEPVDGQQTPTLFSVPT